jgi:hypothetical protein
MSIKNEKGSKRFKAMLRERAKSARRTGTRLDKALDRFERNQLKKIPSGSKLTVRNLALEAEVSKDTPLSRYPKSHKKKGKYRFPKVVVRFKELKIKLAGKPSVKERKRTESQRLRDIIKEKDEQILLSARANNVLDAKNSDLENRNRDLEKEVTRLREENARLTRKGMKNAPL